MPQAIRNSVVTTHKKGSRGSDPRPLSLTMGWLLDAYLGSDPYASRIVQARGLDQPARMREVVCHRSEWPASLSVDAGFFAVATTLQTMTRLLTEAGQPHFRTCGVARHAPIRPESRKRRKSFTRLFLWGLRKWEIAIDNDCSA